MAKALKQFEFWESAFGYCRERDHPITVLVKGNKVTLFPSGHVKYLTKRKRKK